MLEIPDWQSVFGGPIESDPEGVMDVFSSPEPVAARIVEILSPDQPTCTTLAIYTPPSARRDKILETSPLPATHHGITKNVRKATQDLTPRPKKLKHGCGIPHSDVKALPPRKREPIKYTKKNVHSRAYRKARLDAIRNGADEEKSKERALGYTFQP